MFEEVQGPRFNPRKFRKGMVDYDLYAKWSHKNPSRKIGVTSFRRIWYLIAEEIIKNVLEERDGVRLPFGLGDFYMGLTNSKKRPINRKLSKELGQTIYYENWETGGKLGKMIYATRKTEYRKYVYEKRLMYSFIPHTDFKEKVSKSFINNPERYKHSQEKNFK